MIEHGRFLQSIRRLRRELLKKQQGNASEKTKHSYGDGVGPEPSIKRCSASLPSLSVPRDYYGAAANGEMIIKQVLDVETCPNRRASTRTRTLPTSVGNQPRGSPSSF